MTPKPLAECPDHLDELPEFDPDSYFACGDCGYVCHDWMSGERYGGEEDEPLKYPIVKDKYGHLSYYGWVEDWTEIHYCYVCDAEFETSNGT